MTYYPTFNSRSFDVRHIIVRYNFSRIVIGEKDDNIRSNSPIEVIIGKDIDASYIQEALNCRTSEIMLQGLMSENLITPIDHDDDDIMSYARSVLDNG